MNTAKTWYIRKQFGEAITGPFPGGQISQGLLLGRYKLEHEVSHDKKQWLTIREVEELVPDVFTEDHDKPGFDDRLAAARRWADERRGLASTDAEDRRKDESYENKEIKRLHRLANNGKKKASGVVSFVQLSVALLMLVAVVVLAFQYSPEEVKGVDCSSPAKQGVNWSGCNLSGIQLLKVKLVAANLMNINLQTANLQSADLSYTNLKYAQLHLANLKSVNFTKANLTGASLIGADLTNAVFSYANLSHVNFSDAIISKTDFSNARLDNAIWVDGRVCGLGSTGSCKK